ncbi:hypothetical protein, partial [Paracidovorax avenae]|uniref:hypothetical protein n=1 Tax=Paracidovorax avenae TaxID=80867 RepID=UPI001CEF7E15
HPVHLFKEDLLAGLLGQGIEPQHLLLLRHARHLACGSLHAPVSDWVLQTFLKFAHKLITYLVSPDTKACHPDIK